MNVRAQTSKTLQEVHELASFPTNVFRYWTSKSTDYFALSALA